MYGGITIRTSRTGFQLQYVDSENEEYRYVSDNLIRNNKF